jgi:hypothetical protein
MAAVYADIEPLRSAVDAELVLNVSKSFTTVSVGKYFSLMTVSFFSYNSLV